MSDQPGAGEGMLAAIAGRPAWSRDLDSPSLRDPAPLPCGGRVHGSRCEQDAVAFAPGLDRAYCSEHARRASSLGRRVVPLVVCARCGRRGGLGARLAFEGESVRVLCRSCAELVRELVEGGS
jgi:hypothetical protein